MVERLRKVRGPDLESNIVDLGLVSEILIKDGRVSFSITVPALRASELEPLRQAAEKTVRDLPGVANVIAVLTAEAPRGGPPQARSAAVPESSRVQAARAKSGGGAPAQAHSHGHNHGHSHAPAPAQASGKQMVPASSIS